MFYQQKYRFKKPKNVHGPQDCALWARAWSNTSNKTEIYLNFMSVDVCRSFCNAFALSQLTNI